MANGVLDTSLEFLMGDKARDGQLLPQSSEHKMLTEITTPSLTGGRPSRKITNINQDRIRYAISHLAALNVPNVQRWLEAVAIDSPKSAVELYIQLLGYSIPQLKAQEVKLAVEDNRDLKTMSLSELQQIAQTQTEPEIE